MPRLIVLGLVLVALVILALQNLSLSLPLVVLGTPTGSLPLALWLVGAIAVGAICTLLIFWLVNLGQPPRSGYRPMGRRVPYPSDERSAATETAGWQSSPEPSDNRYSDLSSDRPSDQPPQPPAAPASDRVAATEPVRPAPQNRDAADWESFRPPERWDSWEQPASAEPPRSGRFFGREADSADATVNQIDQGWEEEEAGWDGANRTDDDQLEQRPRQTYRDNNLYNPDQSGYDESAYSESDYSDYDESAYNRVGDPASSNWEEDWEEESPERSARRTDEADDADRQMGPDGVYDADYRVIVPPHRPLDEES